MLRSISIPTMVALLCLTSACSSDPAVSESDCPDVPSPGISGEFSATVEGVGGADDVDVCGFATSSGAAGIGWSAMLITPGGENSILFWSEGEGLPDPGTYEIVEYVDEDTWAPGKYVMIISLSGDVTAVTGYSSVSGTLTITSSSASRVTGEFDLDVRASVVEATGPVVGVSGTFSAVNTVVA